jgi:dihydroflavonol-4-reductase
MTTLVTGGTGFVGAHVVRALLRRDRRIRCLVRRDGDRRNLAGLPIEIVEGDLGEPASLQQALRGCRELFHCAADYRLFARDARELYRVNVDGTDDLFRAAAAAGVERVVYTSSVGTLPTSDDGPPVDERAPPNRKGLIGHYKKSKFDAERVAERWHRRGLPVVIVNPSTPVGERDVKPTPTGQIIVDFLRGKVPAYVDTGLNLIDVQDVAEGHVLASERGRAGEKYILGHQNLSLREIFQALARLTGRRPPRVRLPHFIPIAVAALDTGWAHLTGRRPRVALEAARMARHRMFFDAAKARRDLGLPQSPIEDALARAVTWFQREGYA